MPRALVIGPGAVGLAVADALVSRGFAVGLIGRDGPRAGPVSVVDGAERRVHPLPLPPAPADPWAADLAVLAVKAFDLAQCSPWLARLAAGMPVIPLVNGAVEETVAVLSTKHPELIWRAGFATYGISVLGPMQVELRGRGEFTFGPAGKLGPKLPTVAEAQLLSGGLPFVWHSGVQALVRRKWLYNVVINTLTAARGLAENGLLLGDLPLLGAVFKEAMALGVERWGEWPQPAQELYAGLLQLITRTATNENSMARDRRLGRPTEAAYLAGLAKDATRYPLLTSLSATLSSEDPGSVTARRSQAACR